MFKAEAGQEDYQPDPKAKTSGLLEKKWTSVVRLQKKVRVEGAAGAWGREVELTWG